jgi:flavin reductase (DIM6/NTAB) family NADH-FMN oxidoreductase RutF
MFSQDPANSAPTADAYRSAMRHFPGNVSIITVGTDGQRSGLVATSAVSLSADPPMVLVCDNRDSSSWPLFDRFRHFGVNALTAEQQVIAERFSGRGGIKGEDRYALGDWIAGPSGAPLLEGAAVALDCDLEEMIDRASHSILIGRVREIRMRGEEGDALVYWRGLYRRLAA